GSTSTKTVTLTATDAITLSSLRSSNSQFSVGTPSKALPATLAAGETITVPITFAPTQTGPVGGTLTATTSTGKTADFGLSGNGQAATAQLSVSPPLVSFGGTTVGGHLSGSATFTNVGGAPLTINAVHLPSAPFGASGVPAVGSTIAPGASVTVTVTFDPTAEGTFSDAVGLDTTGGNDQVGLSGSAGSAGVLQVTPASTDYGAVTVGQSVTKSFTVSNAGGVPVTITKSKPPTGGAFAATTTLAEGTTINPGQTLTESVTFAPNAVGALSGTWAINGDDSTGLHTVTFTGSGSVPPPGAPSWTLNGVATLPSAGVLKLTGLTRSVAGSSFFATPLDSSRHLNVAFDATIGGGGTTGADGQTLVLADAAVAKPSALGASGGGLGYSGIPGIAVALDTYKGAVDPSSNFVGIANGTNGAVDRLFWLATSTTIPNLRTATRHVVVDVNAGVMTVKIDGVQYLSQAVTLPPKVLLGFTGATGWVLDNHQVSNVVVSGDGAAPPPPPPPASATLKITNAVSAPSGSTQASQTFTYSGSCPSSFTTSAIGNGGSATPTLTNAVEGASCSVAEAAPSESGWSTSVSVNGGAPVRLTASGGALTVPTFALVAGTNTVAFTNTYTPPVQTTIPSPISGGWQINGSASISGSSLQLTPATGTLLAGSAFWPKAVDPRTLRVDFDAYIGGGTGADGMTFAIQNAAATGASPTKVGVRGGGLGFSGISGIAAALVEYKNSVNPSSNFTGVTDGPISGSTDLMHWLTTANLLAPLQNQTHHVTVTTGSGLLTIAVDGTQVLSQAVTLPASAYVGFTAGDGSLTNRHAVSNVVFS
ncbi:MAG: Ig-like domain-containing protein, partial [Conexibacter sp.]